MVKRIGFLALVVLLSLFAQAAGKYSGTWASSASGNNGKLALSFIESGLDSCTFTYQGQEVKAKPISSQSADSKIDFVFEFDLDGNLLRSHMQGTISGKTMKGKYQSAAATGGDPVDEGTWEVTLQ